MRGRGKQVMSGEKVSGFRFRIAGEEEMGR